MHTGTCASVTSRRSPPSSSCLHSTRTSSTITSTRSPTKIMQSGVHLPEVRGTFLRYFVSFFYFCILRCLISNLRNCVHQMLNSDIVLHCAAILTLSFIPWHKPTVMFIDPTVMFIDDIFWPAYFYVYDWHMFMTDTFWLDWTDSFKASRRNESVTLLSSMMTTTKAKTQWEKRNENPNTTGKKAKKKYTIACLRVWKVPTNSPQTAHKPGRDLIFLSKVSLIVIRNSKLSSALTFEISGQGISCATHCNTLQHTATHCNTLQRATRESRALLWTNVAELSKNRPWGSQCFYLMKSMSFLVMGFTARPTYAVSTWTTQRGSILYVAYGRSGMVCIKLGANKSKRL